MFCKNMVLQKNSSSRLSCSLPLVREKIMPLPRESRYWDKAFHPCSPVYRQVTRTKKPGKNRMFLEVLCTAGWEKSLNPALL